MTKKFKQLIENLQWYVSEGYGTAEFSQYSPAGEDFNFSIETGTDVKVAKQIKDYADNFDPDEHAEMWIKAREHGQPKSIRVLIDDAEAIQEMLQELAAKTSEYVDKKEKK